MNTRNYANLRNHGERSLSAKQIITRNLQSSCCQIVREKSQTLESRRGAVRGKMLDAVAGHSTPDNWMEYRTIVAYDGYTLAISYVGN